MCHDKYHARRVVDTEQREVRQSSLQISEKIPQNDGDSGFSGTLENQLMTPTELGISIPSFNAQKNLCWIIIPPTFSPEAFGTLVSVLRKSTSPA